MSQTFTIRRCTPSDATRVLALWQEGDATPSPTDVIEEIVRAASTPALCFVLAEMERRLVGSAMGGFDGWRGNVYRLLVWPHVRRRGIARALVGRTAVGLRAPMTDRRRDLSVILVLAVCVSATLALVPGKVWLGPLDTPHVAACALLLTLVTLAVLCAVHRPHTQRIWVAVFLAVMPIVYVRGALRVPSPSVLAIELLGLGTFVALALGGLFVSPWLFALGMFGHGLGWDLWHRDGPLVPGWYRIVCMVVDVGLGAYVVLMVPEFRRLSRRR